jgi:hypothetical protein
MVEASVLEARQTAQNKRCQTEQVRAELAQVERESASVASLLVDPDVLAEPMAKKAILRKSAEIESRREVLQATLGKLAERTSEDADQLPILIRKQFLKAKAKWEAIANPAQLNQLIAEFVGPSIVTADGKLLSVLNKKPAHDNVHGVIAGACYARYPQNALSFRQFALLSARAVFWARFQAAA